MTCVEWVYKNTESIVKKIEVWSVETGLINGSLMDDQFSKQVYNNFKRFHVPSQEA
jgi:hypothetical protein